MNATKGFRPEDDPYWSELYVSEGDPEARTAELPGARRKRTRVESQPVSPRPTGDRGFWPLELVYLQDEFAEDGPRFRFSLTPDIGWLAFGRDLGNGIAGLDFGTIRALPGGRLLLVRCSASGLFFQRTDERPDYSVLVNGSALVPGRQLRAGWGGTLIYRKHHDSTAQTIFRYQLFGEG